MRSRSLSKEQIANLIAQYQSGASCEELCKSFDRCLWTIYDILKAYDIPKRNKLSGKTIGTLTQEEIANILALYESGKNSTEVGKIIGVSSTFILDVVDKFSDIDHSRTKRIRKHKTLNEQFFDVIDTEEKAYFLGLMYADGNVKKTLTAARITLQEGDKSILDKFSLAVYGTVILTYRDNSTNGVKNTYELCMNSSYIAQALSKLGCVPAKSLVLKWPEWLVDPELQRHFIRGYFDGDGSIHLGSNKDHQYGCNITSTMDFCKRIDEIVSKQVSIRLTYDQSKFMGTNNGITTKLCIGGNRQIKRFLDWLYRDASIYLERKHLKYQELCGRIADIDSRLNSGERHVNQYY